MEYSVNNHDPDAYRNECLGHCWQQDSSNNGDKCNGYGDADEFLEHGYSGGDPRCHGSFTVNCVLGGTFSGNGSGRLRLIV